jgi:hypothetical protein
MTTLDRRLSLFGLVSACALFADGSSHSNKNMHIVTQIFYLFVQVFVPFLTAKLDLWYEDLRAEMNTALFEEEPGAADISTMVRSKCCSSSTISSIYY